MINDLPLVSVIVTSYNREQYIAETIKSILVSSYQHYEVIVVDDCSTDDTVAIAKKFERDNRVSVYINERNLGQFKNRNHAASFAKGKYIKYCDSDDLIYPWTLEYCVSMMEKYPDAGIGFIYLKNEVEKEYLAPKETIHTNFFSSTILNIGPSGTILNSELFRRSGMYEDKYGVPSDMFFNLRMAALFPCVLLKKDFFYYRIHDGQELSNRYSYVQHNFRYLKDIFQMPGFPLDQQQKEYLLRRQAFWYIKDFFVYIKKTGKVMPAIKAAFNSGTGFKTYVLALFDFLMIKSKLKKNF